MMKQKLMSSTALTLGTTNSGSGNLKYVRNYAVQTNISAIIVATGITLKLQASNDETNWSDIGGTTTNLTTTGDVILNVADAGYEFVRIQFVLGAGDTMTAETIITGKESEI